MMGNGCINILLRDSGSMMKKVYALSGKLLKNYAYKVHFLIVCIKDTLNQNTGG